MVAHLRSDKTLLASLAVAGASVPDDLEKAFKSFEEKYTRVKWESWECFFKFDPSIFELRPI
jgi:hypothetical protein